MEITKRYLEKIKAAKEAYLYDYHNYRCLRAGLNPNKVDVLDPETALRNLVAAAEKMSLADSPHDVVDEVLAAVAAAKEVLK